ncbi:phosphonate ABC transporter ATP-binding protein [Cohnella sp. 56]|uniref:phosphonate ABC transporter ATP-binding protein n=1 Tax=Cohnella sp. 56 TaxID=3113722 RepID=UPI0030E7A8DE
MIHIAGLTRKLPTGKKVLDGIHGHLEPGKLYAIVGASGSGKSMLLRCLGLKEPWTSGEMRIDGKDVIAAGMFTRLRLKRKIAYLEQKALLYEKKTALKNVIIGAVGQVSWFRRMTGMIRSDDYMDAMETLENVGLIDRAHQPAEKLSGGERQRVAIARAIAHGAEIMLADEPVTGLDPHSQESIMEMLKRQAKEKNMIIVVALHRLEHAEKFADEIWGMHDGRIVLNVRGRRLTGAEKNQIS